MNDPRPPHPTASGFQPGATLTPGVDDPSLWQTELVQVAAPMLNAARAHKGQRVALHVIGGMEVTGKLVDIIEDDGVLQLAAGENTHYVALHAIAVLTAS